jgi:hypothetical protein
MLLAGGQTALATHVPLALDVPFLWTPMPNDGYLEFINPAEYAVLPMGIPVPGTPPGVIMTEEYTGYTTAAGADIIEVGDSDTTAGDRADFDWVQENRFCELGGPCANGPVNHPGFVGAMGWIAGATEASPHIDPGTGGAHGHSIQEIPPGPLPYLPNEDYYPREFFSGVDVFSIISEGQDATFELASPGGREAALDYNVAFGNTITGFGSPGIPILVFAPGWTAATTIDDFVARWVPVVPGLYNVIAIEPETGATGHDDITEIDAVKAWFVPEPSSIGLMLVGLLGFGLKCRRRMT